MSVRQGSNHLRLGPWLLGVVVAALILTSGGVLISVVRFNAQPSPSPHARTVDDRTVIGAEEPVLVSTEGHEQPIRVLADVDTGAHYSSIDRGLSDKLGIDLDRAKTVIIETAMGEEKRPLVEVRMKVAGKTFAAKATVGDQDGFGEKVLLGRQALGGFLVDPSGERLTSPRSSGAT